MHSVVRFETPPSLSMRAFQRTRFGDYVLHDRIGAGTIAEIFLATTQGIEGFNKRLVIKRALPELSDDEQLVRMFVEEAKLCGSFRHPNIVQVYDLGAFDQHHFIAMEFVDGRDLLKTLETCRKKEIGFPTDIALYIVMHVLRGLHYVHNLRRLDGEPRGIIHRDVSPSSVLISYQGEVKIGDFGVAKSHTSPRTAEGVLKGKFGYMAPEQVAGVSIDHKADIFAAGVVLYELLTGHRLYAGDNDLAVLERIRDGVIEPALRHFRDDLDEELEHIVMRALARNPKDRFDSAGDLHDALHSYAAWSGAPLLPVQLGQFMQELFLSDFEEQERRKRLQLPPVLPVQVSSPGSPADSTIAVREKKEIVPSIPNEMDFDEDVWASESPVPPESLSASLSPSEAGTDLGPSSDPAGSEDLAPLVDLLLKDPEGVVEALRVVVKAADRARSLTRDTPGIPDPSYDSDFARTPRGDSVVAPAGDADLAGRASDAFDATVGWLADEAVLAQNDALEVGSREVSVEAIAELDVDGSGDVNEPTADIPLKVPLSNAVRPRSENAEQYEAEAGPSPPADCVETADLIPLHEGEQDEGATPKAREQVTNVLSLLALAKMLVEDGSGTAVVERGVRDATGRQPPTRPRDPGRSIEDSSLRAKAEGRTESRSAPVSSEPSRREAHPEAEARAAVSEADIHVRDSSNTHAFPASQLGSSAEDSMTMLPDEESHEESPWSAGEGVSAIEESHKQRPWSAGEGVSAIASRQVSVRPSSRLQPSVISYRVDETTVHNPGFEISSGVSTPEVLPRPVSRAQGRTAFAPTGWTEVQARVTPPDADRGSRGDKPSSVSASSVSVGTRDGRRTADNPVPRPNEPVVVKGFGRVSAGNALLSARCAVGGGSQPRFGSTRTAMRVVVLLAVLAAFATGVIAVRPPLKPPKSSAGQFTPPQSQRDAVRDETSAVQTNRAQDVRDQHRVRSRQRPPIEKNRRLSTRAGPDLVSPSSKGRRRRPTDRLRSSERAVLRIRCRDRVDVRIPGVGRFSSVTRLRRVVSPGAYLVSFSRRGRPMGRVAVSLVEAQTLVLDCP